jgi:predicted nuclease of restriction endonuclease-like RecB superfamily
MLTADLVRARRKSGKLEVAPLGERAVESAIGYAEGYLAIASTSVGATRGELEAQLDAIPISGRDQKLAAGIRKLVLDLCDFESDEALSPIELRRKIFEASAAARREGSFDRAAIVERVATEAAIGVDALEIALFADLRDAHVLKAFAPIRADRLVESYDLAQRQAVLLRATKLTARVKTSDAGTYRTLFRRLKFRRLLCAIHPEADGYRIEIDGPMSLFGATTKYGLGLALVLPAIMECDRWRIDADLAWGKARERLGFTLEGRAIEAAGESPPRLPDEVEALATRFEKADGEWSVQRTAEILDLPGVGLAVPDLAFVHRPTGEVVYLEVLGFWSREAVWKRVELARAGLPYKIVFAASSRLRVSEAVLDGESHGALYVYKGALVPRDVEAKLELLRTRG